MVQSESDRKEAGTLEPEDHTSAGEPAARLCGRQEGAVLCGHDCRIVDRENPERSVVDTEWNANRGCDHHGRLREAQAKSRHIRIGHAHAGAGEQRSQVLRVAAATWSKVQNVQIPLPEIHQWPSLLSDQRVRRGLAESRPAAYLGHREVLKHNHRCLYEHLEASAGHYRSRSATLRLVHGCSNTGRNDRLSGGRRHRSDVGSKTVDPTNGARDPA